MPHRVCCLLFPGFQLLDVAGPIAAFEIASQYVPRAYSLRLRALSAGPVLSSAGFALEAEALTGALRADTLLVAGGGGVRAAMREPKLCAFVRHAARRVSRVASVCSGALLLAQAGLLDGKRATHWSCAAELQRRFPAVRVDADRIWVRDGCYWTSAGISAGIDLALALIREDLGAAVARDVARQLVVYAERPGGQTQHSELLELSASGARFAELNLWAREHLMLPLSVQQLAERAKMSPRSFARAYAAEVGVTPARAVERMRLEAARALLDSGQRSILDIAQRTGFGNPERMRRSFTRYFGRPPAALRAVLLH
jgi:transcriptional regulator GlxA family with amidase domain